MASHHSPGNIVDLFPPADYDRGPRYVSPTDFSFDETEGAGEFFDSVDTWLSGFGFGMFAATMAITLGAIAWLWLA